jgi:hypothetical protein
MSRFYSACAARYKTNKGWIDVCSSILDSWI